MSAPATVDDFLDVVRKSNQVDPGRLDAYLDQQRQSGSFPPDPRKLAALMVREGVLTSFQAEQFLQGKFRGFHLGGYRLLERLGQGGTGTVYLAEHEVMKRRVALKVVPAALANDRAALERFRREAQAAAALDHPNIVRAYDFRQEGRLYFLVMEYVSGLSLQQVLDRQRLLPVEVACDYVRQAAMGLHHAHEAGMVHRDIKPGNLLVDPCGTVKILDMGLARFTPPGEESLTRKFDENTVMGTADYISPEQAINLHDVDPRADQYSLGATLYALLAGQPPFGDGLITQKLLWHQMRDPVRLEKRRPEVPSALSDVVARMMAKEPDARFPDLLAVADALAPFCSGAPVPQKVAAGAARTNGGRTAAFAPGTSSSKLARSASVRSTRNGAEAEAVAERPPRPAAEPRFDDVRQRITEARRPPDLADSGGLGPVVLLVGAMLGILGLVGAVVGFLIWGPQPSAEKVVVPVPRVERNAPVVKPPPGPAAQLPPNAPGPVYSVHAHAKGAERVAFSTDGKAAVTGGHDNLIRVWDVVSHRTAAVIKGHTGPVYSVAFSRDGLRVLSGSADGTARLWVWQKGNEFTRYGGAKGTVWFAVFNQDEREVITAAQDGIVRVYDTTTGKLLRSTPAHTDAINWLALRPPAGTEVMTASWDKSLELLDLKAPRKLRTFKGHTGPCTTVAFVPGGQFAVSGGREGKVILWDVNKGQPAHTFTGHAGEVWVVATSPNGNWVASGGVDKKVYLWTLRARKLMRTFDGHTNGVTGLSFSPDSKHLLSASKDGTMRLWPLP